MAQLRYAALGDSLTQGFMSGAIHNTQHAYPALIARALGLHIPLNFRTPYFPKGGLPFNIEALLRRAKKEMGDDISRIEWLWNFPLLVESFLDEVEDYYEGRTKPLRKSRELYHNLAVWGFTVHDALTLTSARCDTFIEDNEGWVEDDFMSPPSGPMYRTAKRVFNPGDLDTHKNNTMLDTLALLAAQEGGLDVLTVWFGANDALGTVLELELRDMAEAKGPISDDPDDRHARQQWNLTSADQFQKDYERLAARLDAIAGEATKVFVGTVPAVTIPPVTTGIGHFDGTYYDYYTRFFIQSKDAFNPCWHKKLTREEARRIDERIDSFNNTIRAEVAKRPNWHIVDTAEALRSLAVRRNQHENDPERPLRDYYKDRPDHPLLQGRDYKGRAPSILMLKTEDGMRTQGGLMSLDGTHPSVVGYGIAAELFLTRMQQEGVPGADPLNLFWPEIIRADTLLQEPPAVWDDVFENATSNDIIWDLMFRALF